MLERVLGKRASMCLLPPLPKVGTRAEANLSLPPLVLSLLGLLSQQQHLRHLAHKHLALAQQHRAHQHLARLFLPRQRHLVHLQVRQLRQ